LGYLLWQDFLAPVKNMHYNEHPSSKLPVLNLLKAKSQILRPAGATRCTDSRQTWQGRRAPGSAWLCKISPQSAQGVGMRPQNMKNFHFLVKSRHAEANPLTDF